jgi:pimeloyl-ACP methyl ester carboxylesterase
MNVRGLSSRFVRGAGVGLHVYDGRGRGKLPTTVLVHGLGAAGPSFARVVPLLLPHVRRLLIPELPGHGRSEGPSEARLSPDRLLDAMTASLDAIVDEPAILYGNSLGGAVALEYAIRRPERVRALLLVSPAGARMPEVEWRELLETFDVQDRRSAQRFLERIYHRPPWFLALVAHEFPDLLNRRAVRDLLETASHDHAPSTTDLSSLRMPILLVWGRSDRLLPRTAFAWFRHHLPPHTVVEEPDEFGHAPQIEHPNRVAERILRFARDVVASPLPTTVGAADRAVPRGPSSRDRTPPSS